MLDLEATANDDCGCGDERNCHDIQSCRKSVCKSFDVSVPVTVTPFAVPEKPDVKCAGEITISPGHKCCESDSNSFEFTITQRVYADIPIKFGAVICYDETCAVEKGKCDKQAVNDIKYYSENPNYLITNTQ